MLAPRDRLLLLDALRPPAGGHLLQAVGTTYTLDLATALTVPLAFAGHALTNSPDPVTVMDSIRRSASSLDIFCQSGAIAAGRWPSDLVALLEPVIHEVPRPRPGHLFHPKMWAAQYVDGEGISSFRVLVLSRNLTSSQSWDVVVRLDGVPSKRLNRDNDGLVRFLQALPRMTKGGLIAERNEAVRALADSLRRVDWDLPDGVSDVRFWPLGLPGAQRVKLDDLFSGYRHLIISPFLTPDGLDCVVRPGYSGSDVVVISRVEELDKLEVGALDGYDVRVLNPLADFAQSAEDDVGTEGSVSALLGDLHAKVIIVERNHRAHAFVGSANATGPAFGGNVELMCELDGGPARLGVGAVIGDDGIGGFLEAYASPSVPVEDPIAELGHNLEAFLVDAAQLAYHVRAFEADDGWHTEISTRAPLPVPAHGIAVSIGPFNHPAEQASLKGGEPVRVEMRPRDGYDITPFLVLRARGSVHGRDVERATVVCATLEGGPVDRLDEVLVRQLDSPEKFLQFLLLLLGFGELGAAPLPSASLGAGGAWWQASSWGVFELLVRGLATDPTSIDRLDEIVRRLMTRENGRSVLPEGWDGLWTAVVEARRLVGIRA